MYFTKERLGETKKGATFKDLLRKAINLLLILLFEIISIILTI